MSTISDEQILGCLREQQLTLAEKLAIERYGRQIMAFLTRTLNDREVAKEAYGDFCVLLVEKLPQFDHQVTLKVWMYRRARVAQRRRVRSAMRKQRLTEYKSGVLPQCDTDGPVTELERSETHARHAALRAQIPKDDLELLTLYYDEDLTSEDVAEILGTTSTNVRKRVSRIRKRLRVLNEST